MEEQRLLRGTMNSDLSSDEVLVAFWEDRDARFYRVILDEGDWPDVLVVRRERRPMRSGSEWETGETWRYDPQSPE